MCEIKDEFIKIAMADLDKEEKYLTKSQKDEIAEFRWNNFLRNFMEESFVRNYAVGNWIK